MVFLLGSISASSAVLALERACGNRRSKEFAHSSYISLLTFTRVKFVNGGLALSSILAWILFRVTTVSTSDYFDFTVFARETLFVSVFIHCGGTITVELIVLVNVLHGGDALA